MFFHSFRFIEPHISLGGWGMTLNIQFMNMKRDTKNVDNCVVDIYLFLKELLSFQTTFHQISHCHYQIADNNCKKQYGIVVMRGIKFQFANCN